MIIALAGNQNCGKTTLFNQLTGSNQHVGNFPGVTVERKEGFIKKHRDVTVVDLPGIYSMAPYTAEEIVARDFLIKEHPDAIINIVDATNIERNLYLTLQLMELGIPMIIALNMMDEVKRGGGSVDAEKLSEELGVPVVLIVASKNQGVTELINSTIEIARTKRVPKKVDFCHGPVHQAIHSLAHLIEDHAEQAGYPVRYAATKLIEGDEPTIAELAINQNELEIRDHIIAEMEASLGTDKDAALADMRYAFIEEAVAKAVQKPKETVEQRRSINIDKVLTHKIWALPIFVGVMLLIFYLTFDVIGNALSELLAMGIDALAGVVEKGMIAAEINPVVRSLVLDGVFAGVGSVLSFLPIVVTLFFFLSILEDSGYMARVAFVMDKLLRKIGLSGRSFVPLLIGFGCSVPAIMSTRTLSSQRDRTITAVITPFMSCSAKLPIYSVFITAFFPENRALIMGSLYFLGMIVAILSALLLKSTVFKGKPMPFVMELPAYRLPSPKSVVLHMWEKAKEFVKKAFTIILAAAVVIWFLQTFDIRFNPVENSADSMLAGLGRIIAPIFKPLGFGSWQASTALVTGLTAKETIVSTMSILLGASIESLPAALGSFFTPLSAYAFLTFALLYMPCVAAFGATRKELGGGGAVLAALYQTATAWVIAFIVYNAGLLVSMI